MLVYVWVDGYGYVHVCSCERNRIDHLCLKHPKRVSSISIDMALITLIYNATDI